MDDSKREEAKALLPAAKLYARHLLSDPTRGAQVQKMGREIYAALDALGAALTPPADPTGDAREASDRHIAAEALREAARIGGARPDATTQGGGVTGAVGTFDKGTGRLSDVRVTEIGGVPVLGDAQVLPHSSGGSLFGFGVSSVDWPSWLLARADTIEGTAAHRPTPATREQVANALGLALANAYDDDNAVTIEEPVADALMSRFTITPKVEPDAENY